MSEAVVAEVHALGIAVSLVNPGAVQTYFTEARGVPFQRRVPRPVPADRVARAVLAAIERDRFEQTIPRWLRSGPVARAIAPHLYRRGLLFQSTAREAAALVHRIDGRSP